MIVLENGACLLSDEVQSLSTKRAQALAMGPSDQTPELGYLFLVGVIHWREEAAHHVPVRLVRPYPIAGLLCGQE